MPKGPPSPTKAVFRPVMRGRPAPDAAPEDPLLSKPIVDRREPDGQLSEARSPVQELCALAEGGYIITANWESHRSCVLGPS